jgi:hypothetical protein
MISSAIDHYKTIGDFKLKKDLDLHSQKICRWYTYNKTKFADDKLLDVYKDKFQTLLDMIEEDKKKMIGALDVSNE